jgi:hypothetical protein
MDILMVVVDSLKQNYTAQDVVWEIIERRINQYKRDVSYSSYFCVLISQITE